MPRTKADIRYFMPIRFSVCNTCDYKVDCTANGNKQPVKYDKTTKKWTRITYPIPMTKEQTIDHKKYHTSWMQKYRRRINNLEKAKNESNFYKAKKTLVTFTRNCPINVQYEHKHKYFVTKTESHSEDSEISLNT